MNFAENTPKAKTDKYPIQHIEQTICIGYWQFG